MGTVAAPLGVRVKGLVASSTIPNSVRETMDTSDLEERSEVALGRLRLQDAFTKQQS